MIGGEHLLRLIDDILDLARIEAGRVSISTEPVSVVDVLAELRNSLEPIAAKHGITFEARPLPANLPMALADRVRFIQILMNFGSNAIKYNRPGGRVAFEVSVPDAKHLRVTVEDSGLGIPLDKQGKLFQPFQRAGQETGPIQGTGIGLVITKRLAELMGGSFGFRSTPGEGSAFWVDVPKHESGAPSVPARALAAQKVGADFSAGSSRVVLYMEDNPANVTFMKDLLGTFDNITMVTTTTAEEGVTTAIRLRPDVILMDINLPGMSGLDALRGIARDATHSGHCVDGRRDGTRPTFRQAGGVSSILHQAGQSGRTHQSARRVVRLANAALSLAAHACQRKRARFAPLSGVQRIGFTQMPAHERRIVGAIYAP